MAMKLGWISFLNLHPLRFELLRNGFTKDQFILGTPNQINQWLSEGRVHIAPCSSICLVSCSQHEMAIPLGVSALGEIKSVYFGLTTRHEEWLAPIQNRQILLREIFQEGMSKFPTDARGFAQFVKDNFSKIQDPTDKRSPRIKFTPLSATSTILGKLFYKLWFGEKAFALLQERLRLATPFDPSDPPIELLIGDEALARAGEFAFRLDLGTLWQELSSLPFVYAVWQSKGPLSLPNKKHLLQIAQIAQNKMHIQPSFYYPKNMPKDSSDLEIPLADYWKNINYKLANPELLSLLSFLCLVRVFSLIQTDQAAVSKIVRWQKYSSDLGMTM